MKPTNFDHYLKAQLKDKNFADRFKQAGAAWDVALQLIAFREQAGLPRQDRVRKLKTFQ